MMNESVMGIDPGVRGGVAVLSASGYPVFVEVFKPGMTEAELCEILTKASMVCKICYMEKVGYIKGDGAQGAFTFGKIYGLLRGILLGQGMEIKNVYPVMWQAKFKCLSRGNKNVTKNRAISFFPSVKVTHGNADALLISEFGRQSLIDQEGL